MERSACAERPSIATNTTNAPNGRESLNITDDAGKQEFFFYNLRVARVGLLDMSSRSIFQTTTMAGTIERPRAVPVKQRCVREVSRRSRARYLCARKC